jgi:hypothetical protein
LLIAGISTKDCVLFASISNSRFGIVCFIGVVNSFAINKVFHFGEIKEINVVVLIINLGIFNVCVCLGMFFVILIIFQSSANCIVFLLILVKHKSSEIYRFNQNL